MTTQIIIVGQGICGSLVSYFLEKQNIPHLVIDQEINSPSRIASGVMNPVTGRRFVESWMAETFFPFALNTYDSICNKLSILPVKVAPILDFFPHPFLKESFEKRLQEKNQFLTSVEEMPWAKLFKFEYGMGKINPVYILPLQSLLSNWKNLLAKQNKITAENFDFKELKILPNGIQYKNINAQKIIFCDGAKGIKNPYFKNLPFAENKGEALIVEIKNLEPSFIYKKGFMLVPTEIKDQFWLGSNYIWNFTDTTPTPLFYEEAEGYLSNFLKLSYKIIKPPSRFAPCNTGTQAICWVSPPI